MNKNIVVIGGGPGGYGAAIRAAQLGATVTIIEKDKLGGTCLNKGCIPTKALYRSAEVLNNIKCSSEFGIEVSDYALSPEKVRERKDAIVSQMTGGLNQLMKGNSIKVIKGSGRIISREEVEVTLEEGETETISCDNVIIATGSSSFIPPIKGADLEGVITSEELLDIPYIPEKLIIIGGGVIGMEFGGIFNSFGSKVTVVEALPSILNTFDGEMLKRLNPMIKRQGIEVYTGAMVKEISKDNDDLKVLVEGKKGEVVLEGDMVLIATGRKANAEGLGLEAAGIEYDRKGIKVSEDYETSLEGVFAIGDVNGRLMLAHAASHQGVAAVERILLGKEIHESPVPSCVFIFPELASVGLREEDLKEKGIEYKVSKFLFGANGKALTLGEGEGLVKVIADDNDRIVGVHILGPHASDLIHEAVPIINEELSVDIIKNMVHAHPTLSEAFYEAVMGLKDEAIHLVPRNKKAAGR